jgi:hypothetical protein
VQDDFARGLAPVVSGEQREEAGMPIPPAPPQWPLPVVPVYTVSRDRLAWHEAGHVVIGWHLCGVECSANIDTNPPGTKVGPNRPAPPQGDEAWLNIIAMDMAGRAAVAVAIDRGDLQPLPAGVEANPGDLGYLPVASKGADHQNALTWVAWLSIPRQAKAFEEAWDRAVQTAQAHYDILKKITMLLFLAGQIDDQEVGKQFSGVKNNPWP